MKTKKRLNKKKVERNISLFLIVNLIFSLIAFGFELGVVSGDNGITTINPRGSVFGGEWDENGNLIHPPATQTLTPTQLYTQKGLEAIGIMKGTPSQEIYDKVGNLAGKVYWKADDPSKLFSDAGLKNQITLPEGVNIQNKELYTAAGAGGTQKSGFREGFLISNKEGFSGMLQGALWQELFME